MEYPKFSITDETRIPKPGEYYLKGLVFEGTQKYVRNYVVDERTGTKYHVHQAPTRYPVLEKVRIVTLNAGAVAEPEEPVVESGHEQL